VADVRLARRAVKDLDSLSDKAAERVANALELLEQDPESRSLDVKPLKGRKPWRRLRVGNHRVVFRRSDGGKVLLVARVVDRKYLERAVTTLPD
jgi:mRNA-degrading endonuclease RelE of RelBE toxin-antitoxin system